MASFLSLSLLEKRERKRERQREEERELEYDKTGRRNERKGSLKLLF
jgi:hypothetical protein